MSQELNGLEYLKAYEIKNMSCNMEEPYAFISYSHDDYDSQIVMNVFKKLYIKGINLWIDTANMPVNEEDWKASATKALMCNNCKFAFFFRSESSMVKSTIAKELETIKKLKHIGPIVTIDIWHDSENNAGKFHDEILNRGEESYNIYAICDKICGIVSTECKAMRLASDMGNDIMRLVDEMLDEAEKNGVFPSNSQKKYKICFMNEKEIYKEVYAGLGDVIMAPAMPEREGYKFVEWMYGSKAWDFTNDKVKGDIVLTASWKAVDNRQNSDGYTYTIFGKEYHAGKREQGKMMYDVFRALADKFPDKVENLTTRTSVDRAEDVTGANTQKAKPTYFRTCEKFTVRNQDYFVGTSYGFEAKMAEIRGMLKICGVDPKEFVLVENASIGNYNSESGGQGDAISTSDVFCYTLWNEPHTADKLATMMHDVFDLIATKYPEKIEAMSQDNSITAVAIKSDVDDKRLPLSKMNYFTAKKEHKVGNTLYYVSTRYNREQGIGQLEKMLKTCEGNSNALVITSAPQKSTHTGKSGKKGIGELMDSNI